MMTFADPTFADLAFAELFDVDTLRIRHEFISVPDLRAYVRSTGVLPK